MAGETLFAETPRAAILPVTMASFPSAHGPDVPLAVRGALLALVLSAHCAVFLAAWHLRSVSSGGSTRSVLQVRWVSPEPPAATPTAAPAPAPEPEIAPEPLPMRPPSRPKPRPRVKPALIAMSAGLPSADGDSGNAPAAPETPPQSLPAMSGAGAPASGGSSTPELTAPRYEADYLSNPAPEYPPLSRRLLEQGVVLLRIHITADGLADQVVLQKSSSFPRLDQAAGEVVWRWRFVPARRGQENVPGWVVVPIHFRLRS
jgi:protein TonB